MSEKRHMQAGVTLIEMLVSLAIFAVIGVAGLTVLDTVARTQDRTDGRLDRLAEIDRAFLVIRRDLAQIATSQMQLAEGALGFRRLDADGSWTVTYRLDGTTLTREIGLPPHPPIAQRMLDGVGSVEWRVMYAGRQWAAVWPPDGTAPLRPKAAELTLDVWREGHGGAQTVTRLFPLPGGQGR